MLFLHNISNLHKIFLPTKLMHLNFVLKRAGLHFWMNLANQSLAFSFFLAGLHLCMKNQANQRLAFLFFVDANG